MNTTTTTQNQWLVSDITFTTNDETKVRVHLKNGDKRSSVKFAVEVKEGKQEYKLSKIRASNYDGDQSPEITELAKNVVLAQLEEQTKQINGYVTTCQTALDLVEQNKEALTKTATVDPKRIGDNVSWLITTLKGLVEFYSKKASLQFINYDMRPGYKFVVDYKFTLEIPGGFKPELVTKELTFFLGVQKSADNKVHLCVNGNPNFQAIIDVLTTNAWTFNSVFYRF